MITSTLNNDIIQQYQGIAPSSVLGAIKQASAASGVDFAYLVNQAKAESSFNPSAKAKTSSASGLFQFIEKTWLSMVKKHGDKYGLEKWSNQIDIKNGQPTVDSPSVKNAILNLRNDAEVASNMAAELAKDNQTYLKHHVRGFETASSTDLYLAHFLGANGAARFINAMNETPEKTAHTIFKKEAAVNKGVFFDSQTGNARSLKDVYAFFESKFQTPKTQTPPSIETNLKVAQTDNTHQLSAQDMAVQAVSMMYQTANINNSNPHEPAQQMRDMGYLSPLSSDNLFLIHEILSDLDDNTAFL